MKFAFRVSHHRASDYTLLINRLESPWLVRRRHPGAARSIDFDENQWTGLVGSFGGQLMLVEQLTSNWWPLPNRFQTNRAVS